MREIESPGGIPRSFMVPLDRVRPPKPVVVQRTFVDWGPFYEGGRHTLLQGRTGSGKTTLLLQLLGNMYAKGHRILLRDDGGLDFLYLAEHIPMTVWVPRDCRFTLAEPERYKLDVQSFREPREILDAAYTESKRFHAVLYDCFCSDPGPAAEFYSELFRELIYKAMQTERAKKDPLVFSFDELNDLVQPRGMELTKGHTNIRGMVEYNIRKLRKHRVTLIASTHRFNQIGINVRSQFSYIMIKQSYGKDVYDFISHNLITAANEGFWSTLRTLTTMGPEYAYIFDYKNSYDKMKVPDIPRPEVRYSIDGSIKSVYQGKPWDDVDVCIAVLRVKGLSLRDIANHVGLGRSAVHERAKRLDSLQLLREALV